MNKFLYTHTYIQIFIICIYEDDLYIIYIFYYEFITYYEFFDAYVDDHLISVEHERELFTKIKFQWYSHIVIQLENLYGLFLWKKSIFISALGLKIRKIRKKKLRKVKKIYKLLHDKL